jgi:hypothetical protein
MMGIKIRKGMKRREKKRAVVLTERRIKER